MAVEVGISLVVLDAILRDLRVSPYNRDVANISFPPESAASSFWGWENCKRCDMGLLEQWLCSVFQFFDTWSWNDWNN